IADLLDAYGVARKDYEFDMGVGRGLDYYTGMVFEIDSPNLGAEKQVGGGGAYNLAEVFGGESIAQTGFALGLDRLAMAAEAEKTIEPPRSLDAYVVPIGDTAQAKAIEILTTLRAAGLGADIDLVGRGPSKNLDYANAIGARTAILLGERELKTGKATVRDMARGVFLACRSSSRRIWRTWHGPGARVCISSKTHRSRSSWRTGGTFVTTYRHTRSSRTWWPQCSSRVARPFCPHG